MRLGRPLVPLELTTEEQTRLESWARRRTTAQALALRARASYVRVFLTQYTSGLQTPGALTRPPPGRVS